MEKKTANAECQIAHITQSIFALGSLDLNFSLLIYKPDRNKDEMMNGQNATPAGRLHDNTAPFITRQPTAV